ncbi:hypothetical protein, partial [uncultured Bacteroides sp.]|uniref:hypothetical protein n=1 Tax=uncultured Bacteroides sp. TaxID=162156 RepID=UPI0025977EE8
KLHKLWVITKPGLGKVRALRIKKGCASILTQPLIVFRMLLFQERISPILNNKIILLKTRKPAVIIHIRQSPEKKD